MNQDIHNQSIVEQFTQQARPFLHKQEHRQQELLNLMVQLSKAGPDDRVLDVACGPGIVACAFAAVARQVTGIDLTPAMLEQAQHLQQERKLSNLVWRTGDVTSLPFDDDSFSVVITRFSFHHFLSPAAVFQEMTRVCRSGGSVMVVDVSPAAEKLPAYDEFEKWRDPSHVHAMSYEQLLRLFSPEYFTDVRTAFYKLEMELEGQLSASFPNPGDADRIRRRFREDLGRNHLGVGACLKGTEIHFAYPVTAICGTKK